MKQHDMMQHIDRRRKGYRGVLRGENDAEVPPVLVEERQHRCGHRKVRVVGCDIFALLT